MNVVVLSSFLATCTARRTQNFASATHSIACYRFLLSTTQSDGDAMECGGVNEKEMLKIRKKQQSKIPPSAVFKQISKRFYSKKPESLMSVEELIEHERNRKNVPFTRLPRVAACPHGRRPKVCRECGGEDYCQLHRRIKRRCRQCCGYDMCPHEKLRRRCGKCGGCEHGYHLSPSTCDDCANLRRKNIIPTVYFRDSSYFCVHGVDASRCEQCGRQDKQCKHQKTARCCKICNVAQYCQHGRIRLSCLTCDLSDLCEHNLRKSRCPFCCRLTNICVHDKSRKSCEKCGALHVSLCSHGISRSRCPECKPRTKCRHLAERSRCEICLKLRQAKKSLNSE